MANKSWAALRVDKHGRVVIPTRLRKSLHLQPGDVLVARITDGCLVLESRATILDRLQARFSCRVPDGISLADEIIADRRDEARRESETA